MNFENLCETVKELHEICFNQKDGVIRHSGYNKDFSYKNNYCGSDRSTACFKQPDAITGYCDLCKDCGEPVESAENNKFRLSAMSHGSHSFDFLEALSITDIKEHVQDWDTRPVLFLMENPSLDYGIYDFLPTDISHEGKRPAKQWYWIHNDLTPYNEYESNKFLCMSEYGRMVASLIIQFRLSNAYLTNIVKCGMSDAEFKEGDVNNVHESTFKSTWSYQPKCIKTCMEKVLLREVQALRQYHDDLTVFAFGGRVFELAGEFFREFDFSDRVRLYKLPHPAGRMSNDYRRYVLKGIISEAMGIHLSTGTVEPFAFNNNPMTEDACQRIVTACLNKDKEKPLKVGKQATKTQLGLKITTYSTIFSEQKIVSEIRLADNLNQTGKKAIGYVFSDDSYWAWDYDKKRSIDCEEFRYNKEFHEAIEMILANT